MNVENFNEKHDIFYTEEAVAIYKYNKFENWFKLLKDIFSYTHNAIYSGRKLSPTEYQGAYTSLGVDRVINVAYLFIGEV